MGVVFEVYDTEHDCLVALKLLPSLDPRAIHRFKREFRSLQDIRHPNWVALRELFQHEDQLFFTMELVRGTDIVSFVRNAPLFVRGSVPAAAGPDEPTQRARLAPASRDVGQAERAGSPDWQRLRSAFAQLASALTALHAQRKVHRDIKPSNVLVDERGRVVLLDFGLVTDGARWLSKEEFKMGTVSYMSPEQAAGSNVTAASDWYSFGVMLYEAMTGRVPFVGRAEAVLRQKQSEDPLPPSDVRPVPADLDRLCRALLNRDVPRRPQSADVLLVLTPALGDVAERAPRQSVGDTLVGRERELRELHAAFARATERASVVIIQGESGVGKTALAREFSAQALRRGRTATELPPLLLFGRCSERELIPFKAFDAVIDEIAEHLRHRREEPAGTGSTLADSLAGAALAFPILEQFVPRTQHAARPHQEEPLARRELAFRGVRELLAELARSFRLCLCIDDWQWADGDSIALLSAVLAEPRAPRVFLLLLQRSDHPRSDLPGASQSLELRNLSESHARDLAFRLLSNAYPTHDAWIASAASAIATESTGHPLFISELVRQLRARGPSSLAPRLDDVLWRRFCALPKTARLALKLLAVARTPLALGVLGDAMAHTRGIVTRGDIPEAIAFLKDENLVRSDGLGAADLVDCFHDRVATAIAARLSPDDRDFTHASLALALERRRSADWDALFSHFRAAREVSKAIRYGLLAADKAMATLGFARAAEVYRACLEMESQEPARQEMHRKLGDALSHSGRGREAADAYLAAAKTTSADRRLELCRLAADQLFRSGYVDEAVKLTQGVFEQVGLVLPRSPRQALVRLVLRRAQVRLRGTRFRWREASTLAALQLSRLDASWSVAVGLSTVDTIRGAYLQSRHLLMALEAGEPYRVLRALAAEAAYQATAGVHALPRVDALLAQADELAHQLDDPYVFGFTHLARGIALFLRGDWQASRVACQAAEAIFVSRPVLASWELASARLFTLWSVITLGEHRELTRRVPALIAEAEGRGDLYAATNFCLGLCNLAWLVCDEPGVARQRLLSADGGWSQNSVTFQHFWSLLGWVNLELYEANPEAAYARTLEMEPRFRAAQLLRIEASRASFVCAKGRAALAVAASDRRQRTAALSDAERSANALLQERLAWPHTEAHLLLAGVARIRGQAERAARELRCAAGAARTSEYHLLTKVIQHCLLELAGAAAESPPLADIARPDRWVRIFAPGFACPR
jgi:hypothetical protein